MPLIIPILVLVISIYLVVAPIVENPTIEYLYAATFILTGMIFYIPFVHYGYHLRCLGKTLKNFIFRIKYYKPWIFNIDFKIDLKNFFSKLLKIIKNQIR